jgi:hypothetical protein
MTDENSPSDDVAIVVKRSGRAAARPASFGRLSPFAQDLLLDLEEATETMIEIDNARRHLVTQARAAGVSWHQIGLSVRTTGQAARLRYGFAQDDV